MVLAPVHRYAGGVVGVGGPAAVLLVQRRGERCRHVTPAVRTLYKHTVSIVYRMQE